MTMLARIRPESRCANYNQFTKEGGWYEVDEATAKWCRERKEHDLGPHAPLVFEVKTAAEAKQVVEEEARIEDPSGTPDKPRKLPAPPPPADPGSSDDDKGKGKGGKGGQQ